jgi:hypothetical protein
VAGVGDPVMVMIAVADMFLSAFDVAVRWYVPGVVEWRAMVQGSFTTQGLVPTIAPPSAVQVTVLSFFPVMIAVTVW